VLIAGSGKQSVEQEQEQELEVLGCRARPLTGIHVNDMDFF